MSAPKELVEQTIDLLKGIIKCVTITCRCASFIALPPTLFSLCLCMHALKRKKNRYVVLSFGIFKAYKHKQIIYHTLLLGLPLCLSCGRSGAAFPPAASHRLIPLCIGGTRLQCRRACSQRARILWSIYLIYSSNCAKSSPPPACALPPHPPFICWIKTSAVGAKVDWTPAVQVSP